MQIVGPITNGQVSAGLTAAQLSATSFPLITGIRVKSIATNTGKVYVGGLGVTASNGYQLVPGSSEHIVATDVNTIYVIADTAAQTVCFVGG